MNEYKIILHVTLDGDEHMSEVAEVHVTAALDMIDALQSAITLAEKSFGDCTVEPIDIHLAHANKHLFVDKLSE